MFTPLSDNTPTRFIAQPHISWVLIVVNIVLFGWLHLAGSPVQSQATSLSFGMIPALITHQAVLPADLTVIPPVLSFVTYQFLHGGFLHLAGNMLFLWVFGDNVEDAMGHRNFILFYLLCGIAGGLAHFMAFPSSQAPLIGASGAVSGVLAAYLILYPRARVFGLALNFIPVNLPVWVALGAWIAFQLWHVAFGGAAETAWWAHIGGLAMGAASVRLFARRQVMLFGQQRHLPVSVPRVPLRRKVL